MGNFCCLPLSCAVMVLLISLSVAFRPLSCSAMDKSESIDTNRPSFMNSPLVLPRSSVQLENGSSYQWGHNGQWQFSLPESELRVGLTSNAEFQMFLPNYRLVRSRILSSVQIPRLSVIDEENSDSTSSVVSNLSEIGVKYQLGQYLSGADRPAIIRGTQAALIVGVTPPTGTRVAARLAPQGAIRLPFFRTIKAGWRVGGMQSLLLLDRGQHLQWQPDVLIGKSFGSRADVFVEYGGFFTSGALPVSFMHFGGVYKPWRNHQVDAQVGVGLSRSSPRAFVGVGYSYRLDRLHW